MGFWKIQMTEQCYWDRLGPRTLCCSAWTWTNVSLSNQLQRNYKGLKSLYWGKLWTIRYKKTKNPIASSEVVAVLVSQSCLTLCDPVDCSPPGSSAHGILQARVLEWVAMPSSRRCSQPRDQTRVSCITGRFFTTEPPGKPISSSNYKQKQTNKQNPLISITILKMSRSLHHCFHIATSWQIYIHSKHSLKLCPWLQPSSWMFLGKKNHIFEKLIIICDF